MDASVAAYKHVLDQLEVYSDDPFHPARNIILTQEVFLCSMRAYKEELFRDIITTSNVKETCIRIMKPHTKLYETLFNLSILSLRYMSMMKKKDQQEIMLENMNLFIRKNHDYGDSFQDFQIIGIIVRLNDKINRILTLLQDNQDNEVKDEAVEDTINDLYNYGILALMYKDK